jgi:hypothetical protein
LHSATVGEWKRASYSNKLATAADWAIAGKKLKRKVKQSGNIDTLKPYAIQLVRCIDEAAAGSGYEGKKAAELGGACIILMGWN